MDTNYWWVWMIIAALCIVAEIFTAGFFILWFGIGAAAAGAMALLGFGAVWQWVVFVVVSFVLFAVSRKFAERFSKDQPPGIGADRFIGKTCVVLEKIDNSKNIGRVRLGSEEWRAESVDNDVIAERKRVIVTNVSGAHLVVRPAAEGD
jgi:membrane protein implicated in regulation of membrane protease activity